MQERHFRGNGVGDNTDEPEPTNKPLPPESTAEAPNPVDVPEPV